MKKAFLFLTMLLFAFMGTMRADEVTVCDGTATSDYVPVYGLYADTQGCQSEFVIPASEIGILPGGQISKLTFYLSTPASAAWTATFQVYMTEIEGTTLSAFVGPSGCTQVYQGALNGTGSTMEVVFDNDYTYNGGNLLIGTFVSTAGNYKSAKFYGVTATGASIQRNSSSASTYQRNFLPKTTFEFVQGDLPATTIVPSENPVQLGVRPIGAWMKPYELAITNQGTPTTVTGVDGSANFAVEAEVPYALGYNGTMPIRVSTTGTPAAGTLNGQVIVSYSDRTFTTIDATAEMYEPVDGDVWEMAEEVTAMPFQGNAPTGIYRNYELGQAAEAADAVYKVTFDNDVLFSAGTNGAGAKTRLYTEDFNGVGGPDADNNYVYNGPTVNPGPMQMWFSYAYSGSNTWYGTSAGGGFYFGYKIPAAYIAELGLAGCSITTVEAAARESYPYECYILKGGANPFNGQLVGYGEIENPTALYFFDITLQNPVLVGENEDVWVIFYSDSPYAGYCGRYPVDVTNGKIWTYNPNSTSPAWTSNEAYTPVIYTRFVELPTGREVTVDLGSMKIKEGNGVASEIAAVDGTAMGVSKAQMYNEAKAQNTRGNRDTQTLIEEGWENGIGDWTMNNCESSTGVYSGTANNGSNCFRFKWTTSTPQYLISPELTDNNGGTMSFYCRANTYTESYRIGYSTTTNDISAFTFGDEVTVTSQLYAEHTATFPAGTKYVAIASTAYDAYYFYVDDITITADVTSGGGSTDPVYQIADMYVPAGTYYVAVASTTDNFQVDMMTSEVPVPEQAVVVSPYDGETNVSDPYLAEWILGDYTTEMQVLVGTQYPPQTALIEWTDYLVESAFITDLEPNQSYFMQVNERNSAGTTMGEIIAFTTPIDPVEGFEVAEANLYPGDAAVFTWDANRSFKGYNLYMYDGVEITKVNDALITENTYSVEGLEYNMAGYEFAVTAVYDAGESELSEAVTVYMTGYGSVSGHVYDAPNGYDPEDPDQTHPVVGARIICAGLDEYGEPQMLETVTDEEGAYTCQVLAGSVMPVATLDGYQPIVYETPVVIAYQGVVEGIDLYTHEFYYPLEQITATEEEDDVLVEWSWTPAEMIVDFETGDFSQAEFTLPATYPWAITSSNTHDGSYAIKSTCEGVASGSSVVEATVMVPYDGKMGFWVSVSSESNYDKFHFYIDGVEQGAALSGTVAYTYKEYDVTEGIHTYKWEYAKDGSVNSGDDCAYVDDITMYRYVAPLPPVVGATTYDFEDGTMQGWTNIDANNDSYVWVMGSQIGGVYLVSGASLAGTGHNSSNDMVCSGSYSNATQSAITPDNFLVSPQISAENGAQIQFYACAQDADYAAEHFGVAVSTSGNTSAADFTTIQEWTMTAKGAQGKTAETEFDIRGTRDQGNWYLYTVDLSSYAGQDIYVAIRHFNCSDQFILNVDDITLATGGSKIDPRGNRSFMSYNLYRRNNYSEESVANPELIAEGLAGDVFEYIDAEWPTLTFGEWQWGIAATYEGYASDPERTIASSVERNADDNANGVSSSSTSCREMWDLLFQFDGTSGYQYGVATDGNYIYTSSWSSSSTSMFYKYDMEGNFVEEFNISGCGQLRGMTYDGQYFYGVANSNTVYCVDLANHALINSFTTSYGAMRCITYDPVRDGFWVVGNWSGDLTLISRTGAIVQAGPAPSSASDVAYYKDENNVEHVYCFNNGTNDVDDYNIANNTITSAVFNVSGSAITGTSGGCFVGTYDNKTCFFADIQQNPQYIAIYELNASSAPVPPTPPTPGPTGEGISEILWSNVIDKDMEATLTFNITLNNGQSPVGALIEIVGEETYTEEAEGATTEIVVRKAPAYDMTVTLDGYTSWTYSGAVEADETFNITLNEQILPVDGLYVSPTGWATWNGIGGGVTPGPQPGNNSFTEDFEGGLNGWNVLTVNADGGEWIHSDDNIGGYDYTTHAHGGTGFAMCYSFVDYVGAFNTDSYLYTPQKYAIQDGSTLSFWADNANDDYPESFSVCVATVDNPTAADFTQVWSGSAKGTSKGGALVRHNNNRYDNWRSHNVDLSAYAGQEVYIAFHDVNYDAYEIWIDDVELGVLNKGDEDTPIKYIVKLDGVVEGETTFNGFQHNVDGMEEGSVHTTAVRPVYINGNGDWMEYTWTYTACDNFDGVDELAAEQQGDDVKLTWTMPDTPGPGPQPGAGWSEGFENGMPEGWTVVDGNNDGWTWCLTSAIPSTWTYYASLTLDWYRTGTNAICSGSYINGVGALTPNEYLVMGQQAIGAGSTLSFWAAATDASYPADHFGVFVSDDASTWTSVQEWTLTGKGTRNGGRESRDGKGAKLGTWYNYTVDLSAFAGNKYIAIRHFNCTDQYIMVVDDIEFGVANKANDRDAWDLVSYFSGTSAGQQAVATDGEYIYTASWQTTPTGGHTFYKYDLEGNFVEGFDIAGATGIRDLTTDGQYFYGTSGGAQIFCLDLANKTLVSTITCSGLTSRHISYDPVRDGFWSGNWTTLALYDRTGALVQNGPTTTSAYGSAYYEDANGEEHLYLFCQPNSDAKVYDYNITTGSLGSSPVFDFAATPGFDGIAGGCFIGNYGDKLCWFGNSQQDPNLIGIYELEAGVVPPTPAEGILGAMIFMDGEPIAFVEGNPTQYVVEGAAYVDATYGVRVVYGGEYDVTYYAMSCMDEVDYVAPPTAVDEISSNTVIYPNPAHDNVTIEAKGMRHITVVSALGQVVYDAEIEADMTQLNLGQFKAGLYMVRIATENGTVVKRVTVVK